MNAKAKPVKGELVGYSSYKAAYADSLAHENPNVASIRQFWDGSWCVTWANGAVTDKRGQRIAPKFVRWAPEPLLTVTITVDPDLRRKVAMLRPCKRDEADDDEVRQWFAAELEAQLEALRGRT
jgi:hypothetical protein